MSNPYQGISGDNGNQFGGTTGYGSYDYHDATGYGYQQSGGFGYQQTGAVPGNPSGGAGAQPIDAMDIVGQSFKGYLKQPVPGMLAMLVHFIITFALLLVPSTVVGGIFAAMEESGTDIEPLVPTVGIPLMVVMGLAAFAYLFWLMANLFNGSRKIADGEKVTFRDYFRFAQLSGCAGVYACFFILAMLGTIAGGFPGLILFALLWPAPVIKADNPEKPLMDCFREALDLVMENLGQSLLFILVCSLITSLLVFIPIVGFIAAYPIWALGMVLFTRAMQRRPAARWE
ncbi:MULTISPECIES: hypothetical protein [unclassified Corynebacterium]|uniref:hypothetical protein n=1 Tax=unclassified Corynebacterium TaxID=2624378 RepID=UPI0008A30049|nr:MULTISPECIES: hypothetical protein [unclassified Corynebacterium]OFN76452.1 hypothetical protein HMPREF2537_10150 [Corynebacterium sp. HMSC074E01]OFP67169.1 hypothetical protein HMPREF2978_03155 [Corynebacterium sp. HMSC074C01]